MVSNARLLLPLPLKPVMTTSLSRGISTLIFFRLCSRAPRTTSLSRAIKSTSPKSFAVKLGWAALLRNGFYRTPVRLLVIIDEFCPNSNSIRLCGQLSVGWIAISGATWKSTKKKQLPAHCESVTRSEREGGCGESQTRSERDSEMSPTAEQPAEKAQGRGCRCAAPSSPRCRRRGCQPGGGCCCQRPAPRRGDSPSLR